MGQKKIIALDAGHGMKTAGKRCLKSLDPNQTREWWLNDRIMDGVEKLLSEYDCTVLRVDDTTGAKDVSLSSRVKTANEAGALVYVAMHHNAGLYGRKGGGTVVFYYNAASQAAAQRLYDTIVAETGLVGNRYSKVVKKGYYVIKHTTMPALLVENGFMDSPTDVPIILSEDHANKTAAGVLSWLVSEFKLCKAGGQEQTSQAPAAKPQETDPLPYITVAKGDTLSKLGKKFGVAWRDIADVNGIQSPYTIHIGQKLRIPSRISTQICYPAYTGKKTTLSAALTSLGITSTYAFRKQIAAANGINGYVGTAAQNTQMYNLLVAGILKKV